MSVGHVLLDGSYTFPTPRTLVRRDRYDALLKSRQNAARLNQISLSYAQRLIYTLSVWKPSLLQRQFS
jgi:hypothetical protein